MSGVQSEVTSLREQYEMYDETDASEKDPLAPLLEVAPAIAPSSSLLNAVASVLKLYLRELSEPLLPATLLPDLLRALRMSTRDMPLHNVAVDSMIQLSGQ